MKYYINGIKNYALFSGRASRQEFWMFFLFNLMFAVLAMILDHIFGTTFTIYGTSLPYGYIYLFYWLFVLIPGLAIQTRRLHDVGKSGWFLFICLIPIAGGIWLLVLLCTDSTYGINKYGPNPKGLGNNQFDSIDI